MHHRISAADVVKDSTGSHSSELTPAAAMTTRRTVSVKHAIKCSPGEDCSFIDDHNAKGQYDKVKANTRVNVTVMTTVKNCVRVETKSVTRKRLRHHLKVMAKVKFTIRVRSAMSIMKTKSIQLDL